MLVGAKTDHDIDVKNISDKIEAVKKEYHIKQHYLEKLLTMA